MAQRLTYRRRHAYATRSNQTRVLRAPGGKLTIHYMPKRAKGVKCSKCPRILPGIPHLRPQKMSRNLLTRVQKSVSRAYGGAMCATCVRERIVRAFLVEEQNIVKKVLKMQKSKEKSAGKGTA